MIARPAHRSEQSASTSSRMTESYSGHRQGKKAGRGFPDEESSAGGNEAHLVTFVVMPSLAALAVVIVALASLAFLGYQVRGLRRQRRNLRHWERGEPLEKTGDWD